MLRRPHLMLANLGGDDRVAAARRLEQRLDRALRHDVGVGFLLLWEVEAAGRAPAAATPPPFAENARLMALFLPRGGQRAQRASGVADPSPQPRRACQEGVSKSTSRGFAN